MPRFFVCPEQIGEENVIITGDDAHHISRSLRMAAGETVTVCDGAGAEYICRLTDFLPDRVCAEILEAHTSRAEPPFRATVWQALPKGEKTDAIIQKSVECGAAEIRLLESERCIVRIKDGEKDKRSERRNRISLEAAKQCGRGCVPQVVPPVRFEAAVREAAAVDLPLFCYEGEGTQPLGQVLHAFAAARRAAAGEAPTVSIMVGSEGGFSPREAELARECGMIPVGLGPRILRTETAAAFVLSCLVYEWELS